MKIKNSIIIFILLAVLYGCKEDEAPDLRMPLDEILGTWAEEQVHITFNGEEYIRPSYLSTTLTRITGEVDADQKEGELMLSSIALSFIYEKFEDRPGLIKAGYIGVWINCKSVSENKIIFSGTAYIPVTGFDVEVDGMLIDEEDGRDLYLNIRYKQHSDLLIGRTFEIDFTDGSAYPEISPEAETADIVDNPETPEIGPMSVPDYIQLAFDNINDGYYSKMGYDKARIRFNDDMSYSLWFREAATGEYISYGSDLHYCYNDDILYFIDPVDFIKSFVPYFNFWGELKSGKMLHLQNWEFNNKDYSILTMDYELSDDKLILTHRSYWSMAADFCGDLMMPWAWMDLHHHKRYYTPKAVFTEVK